MNERESMNALLRKVRQYFGKRAAAPSPEFVRSTDLGVDSGYMRMETQTRHDRFLEWCKAFNERNGHIVPPRSVRSIFNKANPYKFRA